MLSPQYGFSFHENPILSLIFETNVFEGEFMR